MRLARQRTPLRPNAQKEHFHFFSKQPQIRGGGRKVDNAGSQKNNIKFF